MNERKAEAGGLSMIAQPACGLSASLGESPLWHEQRQALHWVDISRGRLNLSTSDGASTLVDFDAPLSAVAHCLTGELLLALGHRLVIADAEGVIQRQVAEWSGPTYPWRFNDGKVDPAGRFWVGMMSVDAEEGRGKLLRVDASGQFETMLEGLTIPNGMAWSADATRFYFIDSPTREIWEFPFDSFQGRLSERRVAVRVPETMGMPDGMAIDENDRLWVAHWGDGAVRCWDPVSGSLMATIEVEDPLTTSCCFGGSDYSRLYITTASDEDSEGRLFSVSLPVAGRSSFSFIQ